MSLFHSPEFVALNGLTLLARNGARLLLGPERGTYGGFAEAYDLQTMAALLDAAPQSCTIKLAPASHDLALFSRSMNSLHRAGFMLAHVDLNYDMPVRELAFADRLADGARKKLAKCARAGFHSRTLERREWSKAHRLLAENRERSGHTLALPLQRILDLEALLPGTHLFFGTFDGNRMIAAAICLRVRKDVLLCYAWGDAEKNNFSPTTQLCERIYEEACFMGEIRLLDVGISTVNGVPDNGLISYKQSLGFRASAKVTMSRT